MMAQVDAQPYLARPDPHHRGAWLADNAAQRLAVRFGCEGVSFTPATATSGFRVRTRIGDARTQSVVPTATGNRVEYRHGSLTEWYVNDVKGLEQGWTLNKRLGGKTAAHIDIDVKGARTVAEGDESIRIEGNDGKLRYRYAGLQAWDADHKSLPAKLHLIRPGRIDIAVDDHNARYPITVDPTFTATQAVVLTEPAGNFGTAVAVDGDTVVVGAPAASSQSGAVYIFSRNQGGLGAWGLAQMLSDNSAAAAGNFGSNVAIHGDTVAVSGYVRNATAVFPAVYIFERNLGGVSAWGLAYLSGPPSNGATGPYGKYALAVYGNTVVAGLGFASATGAIGSVVFLDRNAAGVGKWGVQATLNDPQNRGLDCYGCSVAINGNTAVVGASGATSNQGLAYVYSLAPNAAAVWQLATTLSSSQANSLFGSSVAVNGDSIVVGAPGTGSGGSAHLFGRNQGGVVGSWGLTKTFASPATGTGKSFGSSVAVDGDFVVISDPGAGNNLGSVYAFARNQGGAGVWGLVTTTPGPPATAYGFGAAIALSGDMLIAGINPYSGVYNAYLYDLSGGFVGISTALADPTALEHDSLGGADDFGYAVAVSGDTAVIGADGFKGNQGQAYIFERNQGGLGAWGLTATLSDPAATVSDLFGQAVSVDGDNIAIGAPVLFSSRLTAGTVYVYSRNKNGQGAWGLAATLSGAYQNEQFGYAVSINGSTLAVGTNDTSVQGVSIYELSSSGSWQLDISLTDPLGVSHDNLFGNALAIYGDTLIVGARGSNDGQGAAYIYNRNQGGAGKWGLVSSLSDPTAGIDTTEYTADEFGSAVAVNSSTAIVAAGAYKDAQGRAYVYGIQAAGWGLIATLEDPSANQDDCFGSSVAFSGDTIVVGSPKISRSGVTYVFNRNQGGSNAWGLTATKIDPGAAPHDECYSPVAIDAETVVVGNVGIDGQGSAYVFGIQQPAKDASIAWYNTDGQTVLWNMNGSTIASAPSLGTGPSGWSIVGTADFNGDGSPDILWRNTSGAVVIWFTNGTSVTTSLNLGTIPTTWTVSGTGDFNGDGNSDILWRNSSGDTVIWYMNGNGIASSSDLSTVPTTWTIAGTGDFDDDGNADILWRNSNGDTVIWFIKNGVINSSADLGVIASAWSVAGTGDFNGDGHRDILWRNTNGDVVLWFMNGGTISSSSDLGVVASAWSINGVGDFNGDGKDDILWRNSNGDTVIWFMNSGAIASTGDLGVVASGWSVAGVAGY